MDSAEFRKHGKEMVDIVADYWDSLRERKVLPTVQPGYIWKLIPEEAPEEGERWENIFGDLESVVFSGFSGGYPPSEKGQ